MLHSLYVVQQRMWQVNITGTRTSSLPLSFSHSSSTDLFSNRSPWEHAIGLACVRGVHLLAILDVSQSNQTCWVMCAPREW